MDILRITFGALIIIVNIKGSNIAVITIPHTILITFLFKIYQLPSNVYSTKGSNILYKSLISFFCPIQIPISYTYSSISIIIS